MTWCGCLESKLGNLILTASDKALLKVDISRAEPRFQNPNATVRKVITQLREYFAGERKKFSVPMFFQGTVFQKKVWDALLNIPYGDVCTYAELAARIGHPRAYRAVGNALGRNRIPIIIPCHRVVAREELGGFNSGLAVKKSLLMMETGRRF